jgi:hypothetical protein
MAGLKTMSSVDGGSRARWRGSPFGERGVVLKFELNWAGARGQGDAREVLSL